MTNKIVILDDSVILYEHYISDDKWERTLAFPRGGLTYLLSNGTIKFYAYEDYFYRNCLISMKLPIYIVDEYMHIDGEYENIKDLTEVLDRIFPTNDMDAELNKYLKIVDAELLYQPIGDYALKSDIPDVSDFVTTEELVEALDDYYTKEESDARFQLKGDYATKDELDLKVDKDDVYTKTESDNKYQPKGNYALKSELPNMSLYQEKLIAGENITISGNVISSSGGGVEPVDAYTKAESDARFQPKGDYATESWVLGKNYITSASTVFNNYYTKTELNNKYYTKNEVNNIITNIQNQISALTEALNECCSGTPTPTVKYRWVEMTSASDFVCSGYDKYTKEKKQQSTDGGATWTDVSPAEYRQGSRLIENDSTDCGYVPPTPTSGDYLTFYAVDDTTFMFDGRNGQNIQYSLDSGSTWSTLSSGTPTPTVTSGNTILWKGELTPSTNVATGVGIGIFSSTGKFNLGGNPMSLLYGDNFRGQTSLNGKDYAFFRLFDGCSMLINAERLALVATTLSQECYSHMFQGCISLEKVPEKLLPSTTLTDSCYDRMFRLCKNLTTVLELPATTLTKSCYTGMFQGCEKLTQAPDLLASTLTEYCYFEMFNGCSKLNYIKCLATDISATGCTTDWIFGVASTGTFVKKSSMNSWAVCNTSSYKGIPCNWDVQNV